MADARRHLRAAFAHGRQDRGAGAAPFRQRRRRGAVTPALARVHNDIRHSRGDQGSRRHRSLGRRTGAAHRHPGRAASALCLRGPGERLRRPRHRGTLPLLGQAHCRTVPFAARPGKARSRLVAADPAPRHDRRDTRAGSIAPRQDGLRAPAGLRAGPPSSRRDQRSALGRGGRTGLLCRPAPRPRVLHPPGRRSVQSPRARGAGLVARRRHGPLAEATAAHRGWVRPLLRSHAMEAVR